MELVWKKRWAAELRHCAGRQRRRRPGRIMFCGGENTKRRKIRKDVSLQYPAYACEYDENEHDQEEDAPA